MKLPEDFIKKYQQLLGNQAAAFLTSLQEEEIQKGFRLNPLKAEYRQVAVDLNKPISYIENGFYGEIDGRSLEQQAGYVYSQEPSAMYPAEVAAAKPKERILDLCAAPGGKATQLAGKMNNQGLLVANEINSKRAKILAENLERIGARNVLITNERPDKLVPVFTGFFDKILVDAPCSGEGMFRKDPTAVSYWTEDYPRQCAVRQQEILKSALKMLQPHGQLIYSTCTFSPEEDEQIVAWLLESYPSLSLLPLKKYPGMDSGCPSFAAGQTQLTKTIRLFPHHFKGEGHFIAKFQNTAPLIKNNSLSRQKRRLHAVVFKALNTQQLKYWAAFGQQLFGQQIFLPQDLRVMNDELFYYPASWPDISSLHFIRPGLKLGVFKKKRFEPSYSLALALNSQACRQKIALTLSQWDAYVQGQPVQLPASGLKNGWYLLTCQQKPFSFGKLTKQTLKNYFPKGLRLRYGRQAKN